MAALCLVLAHAAFWIWVAPVNAALAPLTPGTLPENWRSPRDQWEYTHALRAALQIVALAAFVSLGELLAFMDRHAAEASVVEVDYCQWRIIRMNG